LTGEAKKVREVSGLARVQLISLFLKLYAAVAVAVSASAVVSG
jgi:hypothetical protein